jgi:hypothetical protein
MNTNIVNEQQKSKIIQELSKLLQERYIFPKVAKKITRKLEDDFEKGEYQNINDLSSLALKLRKTLHEISKDKHLCVLYDQEHLKRIIDNGNNKKETEKLELQNAIRIGKKENFGFLKVEILEGNIGLIDLRRFYNTKIKEAGKAATAALQFLRNTDAIIFDLRNNGGGEPEMVQLLASYFFEDRTRLNSIERPYEGYVEQYWTYPYLPGKKHSDKDLYILTSKNTFSAAEDFIYALQCQKRVIIVGEITKGGAHPVDFFSIQDLLVLMLPTGRAFNTITNDNWEEKGIKPDIEVPFNDIFDTTYLMALEKLSKGIETNEVDRAFLELIIKELECKKTKQDKIQFSIESLRKYVGNYGNARVELTDNELHYIIDGICDIKLVPLSEELFQPEEDHNERIFFEYNQKTKEIKRHWFYKREREVYTKLQT